MPPGTSPASSTRARPRRTSPPQTDWQGTSTSTGMPPTTPASYFYGTVLCRLQRRRRGRRPGELQGHVGRGRPRGPVHPVGRHQHLMAGLADAAAELESIAFRPAPRRRRRPGPGGHQGDARRRRPGAGRDPRRAAAAPPRPVRGHPRRGPAARRQRPHERTGPGRVRHRAGPAARPGSSATSTRAGSPTPSTATGRSGGRRRSRRTPGWFTGPAEAAAPRVRAAIEQALEDVAAKAASKGD